jgi:hypothetical protein
MLIVFGFCLHHHADHYFYGTVGMKLGTATQEAKTDCYFLMLIFDMLPMVCELNVKQ